MIGGIIYGFKNMSFVRFNKLWATAWVFFILTLSLVLFQRFIRYVFLIDGVFELSVVVVFSFSFFFFGYLIHKFFRKYLNLNGPKK